MTTPRDDAAAKTHAGLTTPEDVLRVASTLSLLAALTSRPDRRLHAGVFGQLSIAGKLAVGKGL